MAKKPSEITIRIDPDKKAEAFGAAKSDLYTTFNSLILLLIDLALAYRESEGRLHNDLKLVNERDWAEFQRWKRSRDDDDAAPATKRKRPAKTA